MPKSGTGTERVCLPASGPGREAFSLRFTRLAGALACPHGNSEHARGCLVDHGRMSGFDAYTETMMRLSDARLADLCREADRHRRAASVAAPRRWRRRAQSAAEVANVGAVDVGRVADVSPMPMPEAVDAPLRRSA